MTTKKAISMSIRESFYPSPDLRERRGVELTNKLDEVDIERGKLKRTLDEDPPEVDEREVKTEELVLTAELGREEDDWKSKGKRKSQRKKKRRPCELSRR